MKEKHVLAAAIRNREAFDRIEPHVSRDDLSEQGWHIWTEIVGYYAADARTGRVDPDILAHRVTHGLPEKHKEQFNRAIQSLAEFDVSPENAAKDLLDTKRESLSQRLAADLLAKGEEAPDLIQQWLDLHSASDLNEDHGDTGVFQGRSAADLVTGAFDPTGLIQVYPESLNQRLDGGVKRGHHLLLFARPEMGKTMMTIEMMAGFLRQGLVVLYIGNEDPISDVNMRIFNRLCTMTKYEVLDDPEGADAAAAEAGYENLILVSLAPGSPREITKLIEEYRPDVLVLDQLRNLNMGQDNFVLKLEQAATQARQWAKRYSCVVVSVTQAGDSAQGKAILDLGDVDYSNTGIPAQADVMIGIGATDQHRSRGEVVISLPKNKVSGHHGYFTLLTEPHYSRLIPLD